MLKKHRRVLWLLNHKTLMPFEVPLLVQFGFEVFVPKIMPNNAGFRSGMVSHQWDETLSIPKSVLDLLNDFDFYLESWPPQIVRLINRYFGAVFVMPYGVQTMEAVLHFEGLVIFRAFGLEKARSYRSLLSAMHGDKIFAVIQAIGDRFWFAAGYEQLAECEPPLLANRMLFLPFGLPSSCWRHENTWTGGSGKVLFVCPNLVTNPYYAEYYRAFKAEFGDLPHVIVGAQDVPTGDPNVLGFVTDEELIRVYQTSAAMFYPSHERRHVHYSPIEAMIIGTPVVFNSDSLLARLSGRKHEGAAKDRIQARQLLHDLIGKSDGVIHRIREDQKRIPMHFSDENCKARWQRGIELCGLGEKGPDDGVWGFLRGQFRRRRGGSGLHLTELPQPSSRELAGPSAVEGSPEEGADFSQSELPLFLSHISGLGENEPWGRWSSGESISLRLEKALHGRVDIEVVGGAYGKNLNCPISFTCGDITKSLSFALPPWNPETHVISLKLTRPCSKVEIAVPHPTQLESGGRKLGVGLCKIRFISRNKSPSSAPQRAMTDAEKETVAARIRERWKSIDLLDECILQSYKPKCILCGHSSRREGFAIKESQCVFSAVRLERYECPSCRCIFGPRKVMELHPAVLAEDYRDLYSVYSEADSTQSEIRAFRALSPRKRGVYLNYGSGGWSKSVAALNDEGYEVYAYDPFYKGTHPNMLTKNEIKRRRFDGIYSNNVIEHFTRPLDEFSFMRSLLKRGGSMSHATACYDYLYDFTRFHTIFFTGDSVRVLASKTKLTLGDRQRSGEFICQVFHRPWW
jgi:hypothetical protein